jgi:hypothetical protein
MAQVQSGPAKIGSRQGEGWRGGGWVVLGALAPFTKGESGGVGVGMGKHATITRGSFPWSDDQGPERHRADDHSR